MKKIEKKNTVLLILSNSITKSGDLMFDFANKSFLASLNLNSLYLVGIYQFLESIIGAIFNLFGGVIADRFKRKKIIILTDILSGIVCILLSFIVASKILLYGIITTNVLLAIFSSFSSPAYKALTREIVENDTISQTNSYVQTASTIIKVTVPILAIGVYNIIGINGSLLLNGLSFICSAMITLIITPILDEMEENSKISVSNIFSDLKFGFEYIYQEHQIFLLLIFVSLVNFCLAGYNLLIPYGNIMFPLISGNVYAAFLVAEAVGGVVGAILCSKLSKELSVLKLINYAGLSGISLVVIPVLYIIFPNLILVSLGPFIFSILSTIFNVQFFSFIQRNVDNQYLGRVFGIIFAVAIFFTPIGTGVFSLILVPRFLYNLSIIGFGILLLSVLTILLVFRNKDQ